MSMTREELRQWFAEWLDDYYDELHLEDDLTPEVAESVLTALRPVSRERVVRVWSGCPACKNGAPKLHIPAFRAMAVCNQHMDHEAFDITLNSKFCLNCGRPLTDEAVDILLKRLEE